MKTKYLLLLFYKKAIVQMSNIVVSVFAGIVLGMLITRFSRW